MLIKNIRLKSTRHKFLRLLIKLSKIVCVKHSKEYKKIVSYNLVGKF